MSGERLKRVVMSIASQQRLRSILQGSRAGTEFRARAGKKTTMPATTETATTDEHAFAPLPTPFDVGGPEATAGR
jgi:hypothetical protein